MNSKKIKELHNKSQLMTSELNELIKKMEKANRTAREAMIELKCIIRNS